jgi:gluconate 5-dehydrogenase
MHAEPSLAANPRDPRNLTAGLFAPVEVLVVKDDNQALSKIMAADLRGTGLTVNLLLPGGATVTGMLPPSARPAGQRLLDPAVMGPLIVWLASAKAAEVHDERIIATEFEHWLRDRKARQ